MPSTRPLSLILALSGILGSPCGAAAQATSAPASRSEAKPIGPRPPAEAPSRMTVPGGFKVTRFAAEPDIRQPIAFAIDTRGRLWVAESFSYPNWLQPATEKDRIVILEDTNGDGHFDRRKVFWDRGGSVSNLSGITLGFGGVWVCATPNLLFIPDRDGDDVPDGEPAVVLDGWDVNARHNIFNGLTWGPDGWLYGCNGILSNSKVGPPGTPDPGRVAINCGVWRYHPTRKRVEAFAHGTTNPWGLDFDDYGEAFLTNCVIPHLFHAVPGARFQRMFGNDFNPHSYGLLASCADHIHWAGGNWQDSRDGKGKHGEAGGGHAHVGAMIYLGDNWPDRYRDSVFTCNVHGHRINNDSLEFQGSGYVARHRPDFLFANDDWFRGLELKYGPDGAVYLTDWSDTGECHETDGDLAHRENGRIYKVAYGTPKPVKVDLEHLDDQALVRLQLHKNDWYVRNARRLLQERAASGKPMAAVHLALEAIYETNDDVTRKLRALWALHTTSGLTPGSLEKALGHRDPHVRSWAIRLLGDDGAPPPTAVERFGEMARSDPSPVVRLALASALQRMPPPRRWAIAEGLLAHAEDASDAMLPLMIWYGVEPLVAADPARAASLAESARIPLLRRYLARRLVLEDDREATAANSRPGLSRLLDRLARGRDEDLRADLLGGILEALRGRKGQAPPAAWAAAFATLRTSTAAAVRQRALELALDFNDPDAAPILKRLATDREAPTDERRQALRALVEHHVPGLAATLQPLVADPAVRGDAIRGLAAYGDAGTPGVLIACYPGLDSKTRADAIQTLASRADFARALLDAIAAGKVPRRDLDVNTARQLQSFGDRRVAEALERAWGTVRPTAREKVALIARYKALLTPEHVAAGDRSRGRSVFNRTCVACHRLFDAGGDVGPDLTGSDRANLDYVLENVLDPSATVGQDFRLTTIALNDGRLISGLLRGQDERTLSVQTTNERLVLPREEVEAIKPSNASMMPEGLFEKLDPAELRDLIAYLASKTQVPEPKDAPRP